MCNLRKILEFVIALLLAQVLTIYADKPCWNFHLKENRSSVCMCTEEYCDEVTRDVPFFGTFVTYSSSEAGRRFKKTVKNLEPFYYAHPEDACPAKVCTPALFLDGRTLYQTIKGFGGAVTDAASINWDSLDSQRLKQHLIDSYFSKQGLEYNMLRVPIGGCDFSTHPYAYNELPIDDVGLANFTLSSEDYEYKLPMIKKCMEAASTDVHIVASPWSPPAWMKSNNALTGLGYLKKEFYQTFAEYFLKFLQAYKEENVTVWAITSTNEPSNGLIQIDIANFNSLGWALKHQGQWIAENLGPTIRNSSFKEVKILCMDDQRNLMPQYFNSIVGTVPESLKYIDGIAVHFYLDKLVPPEIITNSVKNYPDIFVIATEACLGNSVDFGSWSNAQTYIEDIIEDLNYNVTGWIDWNLCLDEQGGPNWAKNYVDSPIIIADDKKRFYKQPMYYAMGHASKFLPRGSRRIRVETLCENTVQNVAFLTPENTIVTLLHNTGEATLVHLVTCNRLAKVPMEKNSIVTVEFLHEQC